MLEQSDVELDFIYHTIGTGTVLPGMLAAKLMTGHPVRFRLISIQAYDEGDWMNPSVIVRRTQLVLASLGADVPADDVIRAEIDVDQRFIGEDYAVPSEEGTAAIRELARKRACSSARSTRARASPATYSRSPPSSATSHPQSARRHRQAG